MVDRDSERFNDNKKELYCMVIKTMKDENRETKNVGRRILFCRR